MLVVAYQDTEIQRRVDEMKSESVPIEPTHEILLFLCGNPVLLAASDEQAAREWWARMLEVAKVKPEPPR